MENENYPNNFEEFLNQFQTEKDCIEYISQLRWPDGFRCPKCGTHKAWLTSRGLYHCSNCKHDTSITVGTVFENTHKPLRLWFHVMWFMMAQKTGVSAKNLMDSMGFGSYQTIWGWLHKLRTVMVRPGREQLSGTIEVDETYIGGKSSGKPGRGSENKTLVIVAVEGIDNIVKNEDKGTYEKKLGRVRFRCIENASSTSLIPFICDNVQAGSTIVTDYWTGYNCLSEKGYIHKKYNASSLNGSEVVLPHVHLVVSLVKRWLIGTHQGAVGSNHLQDYLDEFSFRFNRRLSMHRGKLFYRLMQEAVNNTAPAIKELYKI